MLIANRATVASIARMIVYLKYVYGQSFPSDLQRWLTSQSAAYPPPDRDRKLFQSHIPNLHANPSPFPSHSHHHQAPLLVPHRTRPRRPRRLPPHPPPPLHQHLLVSLPSQHLPQPSQLLTQYLPCSLRRTPSPSSPQILLFLPNAT